MRKHLVRVAVAALLAAFASGRLEAADEKIQVVVHAKPAGKLSARLSALKLSGGKLVGSAPDGGAVVEVTAPSYAAAEAALTKAGATRVSDKVPAQFHKDPPLIISYKTGAAPTAADLEQKGLKVLDRHDFEGGGLLLVERADGITAQTVTTLAADPEIGHVEVDKIVSIPPRPQNAANAADAANAASITVPNDTLVSQLWGMGNIHAFNAWSKVKTTTVIVAVIDTGADLSHEDLLGNLVPGFNFINNTPNPTDDFGHGTHVAGTIAAFGNNHKGVAGVCWRARIMPLKFLDQHGSGSLFNAVKAIDYARQKGARVMSNSWGGGGFSQAMLDAITRANNSGILFVAAAGNGGTDNDVTPSYPASYKVDNVVAVAAIDQSDKLAPFSQYGKTSVHLGAPGVSILSTLPKSGPLHDPSGYGRLDGTSMATPHVSGAAALLLGHPHHHSDNAAVLKKQLLTHARSIPALAGKCTTGGTLDIKFIETLP